jgi:hypothetical protein
MNLLNSMTVGDTNRQPYCVIPIRRDKSRNVETMMLKLVITKRQNAEHKEATLILNV